MIDVHLHFRGVGSERRKLPAVPVVGSYVFSPGNDGRLWQVSALVFDGGRVAVYCNRVSAALAGELQGAWATWGQATATPDERNPAERAACGRGDEGAYGVDSYPPQTSPRIVSTFATKKPYATRCCVRLYNVGGTGLEPATSTV
jgi:hypothetical protein